MGWKYHKCLRIGSRQQTIFIVNMLAVGIPVTITLYFMDGSKVCTFRHGHQIWIIYCLSIRVKCVAHSFFHILVLQCVEVSY